MNNTPPQPKHGRRIAFSGIALTKARNPRESMRAMSEVRDDLEQILIESGYFESAPFSWVGISIRYGMKTETTPHFRAICKTDGELPLSIEIETAQMQGATLDELKSLFKITALNALISAGDKYKCRSSELISQLAALRAR